MKHNRTHCSGITSTDIFSAHPDPELLTELRQTMSTINTVFNHFEEVVDPTLIDCYIYPLLRGFRHFCAKKSPDKKEGGGEASSCFAVFPLPLITR